MRPVLTIARKELSALFQSPVALLFLAVFEGVTVFTFFSTSAFFARNLADVRPLFQWLPLLLIGLVSATTMRAWAEERRSGTLQVLLTLPVTPTQLVLGKFAAGVVLIAVALGLTTPLPLLVSTLGPMDWGPVIGGYLGALLLGAAYLSMGLCVSARTDNQIVALMGTGVIGGALYLVGTDAVADLGTTAQAELARALGSGSRFVSLERGVIDLRDLVYYASAIVVFLLLNVVFLEQGRVDPSSERGRARRRNLWSLAALVSTNAVLTNLWLAPVTQARVDLTEDGTYSLSEVSRTLMGTLDEPLVIEGYFSERTHPLLAPLVPQIRDVLHEVEVAGQGSITVSFHDPSTDPQLEAEIGEQYGVRSFPFGVTERNSQAVVNSYFHLLLRYGDQFEVLSFQDLVEAQPDGDGIEVSLRNLEYDLTGTIKRLTQEFQSLESLLAKLPEPATLSLYVSPSTVPSEFESTLAALRATGAKLDALGGNNVQFAERDPSGDPALQERLYDLGVRPLARDLFGAEVFYLHFVLDFGAAGVERILPRGALTEVDLEQAVEAAIKRATPGQLKTIGVFTEIPEAPPGNPQLPPQLQPPTPQADYQGLRQLLSEGYEVLPLRLDEDHVPDQIDVLLLGKTGRLTPTQMLAIDQYLMRGGAIIALAGSYRVSAGPQGLTPEPEAPQLRELLQTWGVEVGTAMVMDPQSAAFPIPVQERRGGFTVQRIELIDYPLIPDIRGEGLHRDHSALAGVNNVTMPWVSPLTLMEGSDSAPRSQVLLTSSDEAWLDTTGSIEPDYTAHPETGFGPDGDRGQYPLAVSLNGRFQSHFNTKPTPGFERDGVGPRRSLDSSVADGRLVVFGSGEWVSDLVLALAQQPAGDVHLGNLQLLMNTIDWTVEDMDLLSIRSSGARARTLRPLTDRERAQAEWTAAGAMVLPLLLVVGWPSLRRRRMRPIDVPEVPP